MFSYYYGCYMGSRVSVGYKSSHLFAVNGSQDTRNRRGPMYVQNVLGHSVIQIYRQVHIRAHTVCF